MRFYTIRICVGLLALYACNKKDDSKDNSKEEKVTVYSSRQPENGACLKVVSPVAIAISSLANGYVVSACPTSLTVVGQKATVVKVCDSYLDTANDDPNTYQWTIYNKKVGTDGNVVTLTDAEATVKCDNLRPHRS
ncbi:MAG: hypothetical protein H7318_01120 [Oligoflexus sp.]|nr:hypothetical protein [Oligoflexus sp.]